MSSAGRMPAIRWSVTRLSVAALAAILPIGLASGCASQSGAQEPDAGSGASSRESSGPALRRAVGQYRAYVSDQVDLTIARTRRLAAAVHDGDLARARQAYAPSRMGWERIEPVAEAFGAIDPTVDARVNDVPSGQQWTGWHRIEKSLWVENTTKGMGMYADRLVGDLGRLRQRVPDAQITPTSMAVGAKELLDEVSTGKVTGEEERYSHTDLWDIAANVQGSRKVYELLRPAVAGTDPALARSLARDFGELQRMLASYRAKGGYVSYTTLDQAERRKLSDSVNALAEPVSELAVGVVRR